MSRTIGLNKLSRGLIAAAACLGLAVFSAPSHGQQQLTEGPPEFVSYQGHVNLASDGETPINSAADIIFRLYRNANDPVASAIWAEEHQDVSIFNGVFNVYIGLGDPVSGTPNGSVGDVFKTAPLFLGIKIGLDEEITPRQSITSSPFAMTAKHVTTAIHGAPPGTMMMYAGPTAPAGWIFCNGQTLNATANADYSLLFAAIGTTWGGTGAASFKLPDMRGRTPIGTGTGVTTNNNNRAGGTASGIQPRALGTKVGAASHVLTTAQIPAHTHRYDDRYLSSRASGERSGGFGNAPDGLTDTSRTTGSTGGDGAHNNVQPSTYLNFIIKL